MANEKIIVINSEEKNREGETPSEKGSFTLRDLVTGNEFSNLKHIEHAIWNLLRETKVRTENQIPWTVNTATGFGTRKNPSPQKKNFRTGTIQRELFTPSFWCEDEHSFWAIIFFAQVKYFHDILCKLLFFAYDLRTKYNF